MLEKFKQAKQKEIQELRRLQKAKCLPPLYEKPRKSFNYSLLSNENISIIAEFKRASPSQGNINLNANPLRVAQAYRRSGAAALSVLTEERYFKGSMDFLSLFADAGLPLLRKDFILHELQVRQTAASPASAVLLIARMLDDHTLSKLLAACGQYGLEAVVEVFDITDLTRARAHGAGIIMVNNRDLDSLEVNINTSFQLITHKDHEEVWISASGISAAHELAALGKAGFNAALIGTSLMQAANPGYALSFLLGAESDA